jgi:transcriptional regulator with XRE-family HTH domain
MQSASRSGQYLRDTRLEARLSQIEVAAALGVTRQTVIGWEHRASVAAAKAAAYLAAVRSLASRDAA